ncbi:MAG: BrnT family toxin [bacterium]|uniref:BrnT family toxin n=1 Tax=Candidatus Methylomirabilis tolerans TaxID=3123416 RepID=A0AAJ1EII1_9BACT|nr:BrnT family toxin [Candidatus Methylomirabilis sp.]
MMEFEYDEEKSRRNKEKHGIGFAETQRLREDAERVEIPAKADDENRSIVIALIDRRHWSAVMTHRSDRTRIISVRRSRREEIHIYESQDVRREVR